MKLKTDKILLVFTLGSRDPLHIPTGQKLDEFKAELSQGLNKFFHSSERVEALIVTPLIDVYTLKMKAGDEVQLKVIRIDKELKVEKKGKK